VHGYRSRDTKNNIVIQDDGSIVYHAAAVGIVYDGETHTQKHFTGHDDDILALSFHEEKHLVVTGEVGPHPKILLWSSETMEEIFPCRHNLEKGIKALGFSPSGNVFAACASDVN